MWRIKQVYFVKVQRTTWNNKTDILQENTNERVTLLFSLLDLIIMRKS